MLHRGKRPVAAILAAAMMSMAVQTGIAAEPMEGSSKTVIAEEQVTEKMGEDFTEEMSEDPENDPTSEEDVINQIHEDQKDMAGETEHNGNYDKVPELEESPAVPENSQMDTADGQIESQPKDDNLPDMRTEEPLSGQTEERSSVLQNERNVRAMTEFHYTLSETKLEQSVIGGVSTEKILEAAKGIIEKNEGTYGSVNANDNGALSIGKMQWHAYRAARLLQAIISADNQQAYAILGDTLYTEIVKLSTTDNKVWSNRTLTSDEKSRISSLLQTNSGKAIQDKLEASDISGYINRAYAIGLRNASAVVYYTDIENQWGSGGAARQVEYAENIAGSREKITLNEMHLGALCYSRSYNPRRLQTYGLVIALQWPDCPPKDQEIPYDRPWSDGHGVAWLQNALNTYQNAGLAVDGQYGEATKGAVRAFQTQENLDVDGLAGKDTICALIYRMYSDLASGKSDSVTTITKTDIIQSGDDWIYVVNGKHDTSYTGLAQNQSGWWYVENGVVDFSYTGLVANSSGWWRVEGGHVNFDYQGFVENEEGWWYLEGGHILFDRTEVIWGTVDGEEAWWNVESGVVKFTDTVAPNSSGWWCIRGGKVDFGYTGLAANSSGWWRIEDGYVNFDYQGFVENEEGWWYLEGGHILFDRTEVIWGTVDGEEAWWNVEGGVVKFTDTVAPNSSGWWCIRGGKVDFGYTGLAANSSGWWRIEDGHVNFDYQGFVENEEGWWYLEGGHILFDRTEVIWGTVDGEEAWWNVVGGVVKFTDTLAANSSGWWRIEDGKVNFDYQGFAENEAGWWYIQGGNVRFDVNGTIEGTVDGQTGFWNVQGGKVLL